MYLTVKEMAKAGFYDYEIINIGEPKILKRIEMEIKGR